MTLQVEANLIRHVDWETNGCPAAQMAACGLATFIKGRTLDQAAALTADDLLLLIGGLPDGKGHYADLAIEALSLALQGDLVCG